tara:strand:- start:1181 stop:1561 length:381 start_codon:yes stop_codon:yes gene_type:complete
MNLVLAIAFGTAVGAVGRYCVDVATTSLLEQEIPWGTLTVNVVGSLVTGALVHVMVETWTVSLEMRTLLLVGGLGAFTTFSAFSLDANLPYEHGQVGLAAVYVLVSVVASIGALFIGLRLARLVLA